MLLAPELIASCAHTIRAGGLIGLPTETVYGLAADAESATAVASIFAAKGRPADHPLIVHVAAFDGCMPGVAHFARELPPFARQLMSAFWPGPLTLILPRRDGVAAAAAGGQNSIGLRCPAHPAAQALLQALRQPTHAATAGLDAPDPREQRIVWGLAAPSANRFGRISPTTATHVRSELGEGLLVLDGGPCSLGIESTIVDCTRGVPVLLRPGSVTGLQIEQACGRKLLSKEALQTLANPAPRASGTLESHYAPNARLRLMDAAALQTALDLLGADAHRAGIAVYARSRLRSPSSQLPLRTMPAQAAAAAHELFAMLRELDTPTTRLIWVETPPSELEWDGVRDRLQRASAG